MCKAEVSVSIVIPNYNGIDHLPVCLESVAQQTVVPFETIIVDNGSSDGSVDFVKHRYPWMQVISLASNVGVGVAINLGIARSKGKYVAILNNDIAISPQWLEKMVSALEAEKTAGSVACKMLRFFDRQKIDAAGDCLTRGGSPYSRGAGEPNDGRYDAREFIFGACGGAAVYRRETLDSVGVFDEDFVAYFDDVDLAFRAQLAGYQCLYVPEAICYHKRGATYGKVSGYVTRMQERNLTAIYVKNFPLALLIAKVPLIVASRARRLFRLWRLGLALPALRGLLEGMLLVPLMLRKRRFVQRRRAVPFSYLSSLLGERRP